MVTKIIRIILLLLALISPTIYGASIAWDCFEYVSDVLYDYEDEPYIGDKPIYSSLIQPKNDVEYVYGYLFFDVKFRGTSVILTSYEDRLCGSPQSWAQVSYGDEISEKTMANRGDDYFMHSLIMDEEYANKKISFKQTETIYLALIEEELDDYHFGWVELGVENNSLKVLNSAFGLEPGLGLSAGGGAIPEPSTILLYAIGIAAIGLKRRLV